MSSFRQFLKGAGNKPALVEFVSSYLMGIMECIPTDKPVVIAGDFQDGEKVVRSTIPVDGKLTHNGLLIWI